MRSGYQPDFVIDGKIIVELKALPIMLKREADQLYDYLRNSIYELGYLVNFAENNFRPRRIIFTNDRKTWRR